MDSFLGRELEEATKDSSGAFTIDLKRALKLSSLATQPHAYAVLLVGVAVLQKATTFDLRFVPGRASVTFDGQPLDAAKLSGLPGAWLTGGAGSLPYLARALEAAVQISGRGDITLTSGRTRLTISGLTCKSGPAVAELAGTRLELGEALQRQRLGENPRLRPEVLALQAACRWAPLLIRVNDQPLWDDLVKVRERAVRLTHPRFLAPLCRPSALHAEARGDYAGLFWDSCEEDPLTTLTLVENGISFGPVAWNLGLPGYQGVVVSEGLPKDLSLLSLRSGDLESLRDQLAKDLAAHCRPGPRPPDAASAQVQRGTPRVLAARLLADERRAAVLGEVSLKLWSVEEGQLLAEAEIAADCQTAVLALHCNRPWLLAGGAETVLLDTDTKAVLCRWQAVRCAAFQTTGQLVALGRADGTVALHSLPSGQLLRQWKCRATPVALAWHPNGQWLAVNCGETSQIFGSAGQQLTAIPCKGPGVEFSPTGDLLCLGGALYRCPGQEVHLARLLPRYRQIHFLNSGEAFAGLHQGLEVRRSQDGQMLWSREKCAGLVVSADRRHLALKLGSEFEIVAFDGARLQLYEQPIWDLNRRWILSESQLFDRIQGERVRLGPPPATLKRLHWGPFSLVAEGERCAFRIRRDGCQSRTAVLAACHELIADADGVTDWEGERRELISLEEPVQLAAPWSVAGGKLRRLPRGDKGVSQMMGRGEQVALADELAAVCSKGGVDLVWAGDERIQRITTAPIAQMAFSGRGCHLALQHRTSPRLEVWQLHPPQRLFVETGAAWPWALSEDGAVLALGNPLRLISTRQPKLRSRHDTPPAGALFMTSSHLVLAGPAGTFLYRFQIDSGRLEELAKLGCSAWTEVVFRPDSAMLAGLDAESGVHFHRLAAGQEVARFYPLEDGRWVLNQQVKLIFE